jgi:RNA polymerase subunit RPABC4/transcription elongation factor Spt4
MIYLVCEKCRYETREVTDVCKHCGTAYVCDWDPAWYSDTFTLASMGKSSRARRVGTIYVAVMALFTAYAFAVLAVSDASRDAWENFWLPWLFLAFCTYEVWAFTRGRPTTIDRYTHEGVPKNTEWRVFGLILDVIVCLWAIYMIASNDA